MKGIDFQVSKLNTMKVKTVHEYLPKYMTDGAVGFDLQASETYTVNPGSFVLIETGTVVEAPEGCMVMLAPRSSTFKNYGLMLVNSV